MRVTYTPKQAGKQALCAFHNNIGIRVLYTLHLEVGIICGWFVLTCQAGL